MQLISVKVHEAIDCVTALVFICSPWIFGFHGEIFLPQLVLGILEIGAALLTTKDRSEKSQLV